MRTYDPPPSASRTAAVRGTVLARKPRWLRMLVWVLLSLGLTDISIRYARAAWGGQSLGLYTGSAGLLWFGLTFTACAAIFEYDRELLKPLVLDALFYLSVALLLAGLAVRAAELLRAATAESLGGGQAYLAPPSNKWMQRTKLAQAMELRR